MLLKSQSSGRPTLTRAQIRNRVEALGPWFHNIDLNGVMTAPDHPLGDYPAVKWAHFADAIGDSVAGRTVLDIGCNGGFYSIALKRRGARRVVAIDHDEDYLAQARFAAEVLDADIDFHHLSVYEIALLKERFDIVLFMGVLYHLRHPLLALDLINEHVARDTLVFQSMVRGSREIGRLERDYTFWEQSHFDEATYPKLHFVEHSYAADPTNWWVPNRAAVEAMLRSSGFEILSHPEQEVYICRRTGNAVGGGAVYPAGKNHD